MRVRRHANVWSQMKPIGMNVGGVAQVDMIDHAEQGDPKTSSTWKTMVAASSLPPIHC